MRFENKTAIVTGGSSGIGRQIALTLSDEGANIVIADVERKPRLDNKPVDEVIKERGGEATFIQTDVSDKQSVQDMVYESAQTYGGIHILVNNAGIHTGGSIHEISVEDWDNVQAVNLKGVFLCSKFVIEHMLAENIAGDIVNIGSIAGLVGFAHNAPYSASKGGVVELTRSMAVDYGPKGINVNAIHPGVIETAMTKEMLEDDTQREFFEENTLTPRLGKPEDIAEAVAFLVSDKSDFIQGENLVVDGGWTAK